MLFLSPSTWPTLMLLLFVAVLVFVFGRTRWVLSRVSRIAQGDSLGADSQDESVGAVQSWWKRRVVAISTGIIVGSAASACYAWWIGADRSGPTTDLLTLGAAAGAVFACSWAGLGRRRHAPAFGPRVAHSSRTTLASFLPTWLHATVWIVAGASAVFIGVSVVVTVLSSRYSGFSPVLPPSVLLLLLSVLTLGACELIGRLLISIPSRASTPSQLVSDDLVRGLVVRDLATTTLGLGFASMALTLPDLLINLNIPFWPGSAPPLYWGAAGLGTLTLVVSLTYPIWSNGPKVPPSTGVISTLQTRADVKLR